MLRKKVIETVDHLLEKDKLEYNSSLDELYNITKDRKYTELLSVLKNYKLKYNNIIELLKIILSTALIIDELNDELINILGELLHTKHSFSKEGSKFIKSIYISKDDVLIILKDLIIQHENYNILLTDFIENAISREDPGFNIYVWIKITRGEDLDELKGLVDLDNYKLIQ